MGTTETKKMRVGVVGCGAISDIYLTNMIHNFENLEVAACCAGHLEHAKKKAEQYGIKGCTYEEILADPSIEMVVILTPAPTHEGLIRQALEAGKHVYTEKTMTLAPETAAKLIELAEEKHLYLGSAPDTFLGSALQTARKANQKLAKKSADLDNVTRIMEQTTKVADQRKEKVDNLIKLTTTLTKRVTYWKVAAIIEAGIIIGQILLKVVA